jgi:hypothetical protein
MTEARVAGARQTYANHVYRARTWSVTWAIAAIVLLVLVAHAYQEPTVVSFALVALAGVVVTSISLLRMFALRLQNRIIRLEMQVRLARLGREADMARISLRQLVALRFASDVELPALLDRTLAEDLTPDAIKRAVNDWQGDYLRT